MLNENSLAILGKIKKLKLNHLLIFFNLTIKNPIK